MRLLLAALFTLICCPPAAAAPWAELPFQPLGGDRTATCLHAAGADGVAVLGTDAGGWERVELLRVAVDGALAPDAGVRLGPLFDCPAAATAASGAAVVAGGTITRRGMLLSVATRDAGGGFQPLQRVRGTGRVVVGDVHAAIASSGAAVVSWVETRLRERRPDIGRLRVIRRAPGGAFGAPETLRGSIDVLSETAAGIDDAGRATVAWAGPEDARRIAEVATAAPGAAFGAPQRLARDGFNGALALAVAADGGALIALEGVDGVRIFERAPGAALISRGPAYPRDPERERPVVALAPGGGAMLAWLRQGVGLDEFDTAVEVALRAPGGTFQPPQVLGATVPGVTGWTPFAPLPTFEAIEQDGALQAAVRADGAAIVGWLEAPAIAGRDDPSRVALAAGTVAGAWEGATLLGGPGRSADGLAVVADPAAALWTDNLLASEFGFEQPVRSGRLHRALPGAAPPPGPPPPAVTLRARRHRVRSGDPVIVTARCSAACDLRAVAGRAGFGAGQRGGPGDVRLALHDLGAGNVAPRRGRLRVTVNATAPGGVQSTVARLDVRVIR